MAKKGGKSKSKRSNQKILNAFEIAERQANGSNSDNESGDDSDNFQDGIMDARKFLNKDGGKFIDEEIDSDDALGSDDDYDVLNSKFSQTIRDKQKKLKDKTKKNHKGAQISSDEEDDDEAYDSIDEGQLVSLSQAWDMDDDDLKKFETQDKGKKNQDIVLDDKWETESSEDDDDDEQASENSQESDEGSSDEDESEESEEEDIFNASGDDDDDEIDLANTVSHLKSTLKKPPKEKRKLVTESIEENEFNIPSTNKLSINDMISAVDNNISKDAILIEDEAKALNAPLPKNIQQRHERKAAYELTKEEVSKWEDVVQQNRQAEVLKFPLNPTVKHNDTATTFRSDNVPINDMEKQIHKVLEDSSLVDDKKEATFEELAMAKLSPDELKKRTNELRLMRELMFRDETRAKRIKKIKSKTFRKIKKKERLREQELVEGDEIDSDNEDHERKRAEERMNLKHKTNSKWAKSMIKSGLSKDASNRSELEEMLRQGEKLRSKQLGYENGEQSDEDISDIEKEYENDTDDHELKTKLGKGVLAMDFMKNAEERKKQENLQELETLKKLENGEDLDLDDANSVNVIKNQGRRIYTPSASSIKDGINEMNEEIRQEIEDDESRNLVNQLSKKSQIKVVESSPEVAKDSKQDVSNEESGSSSVNPWLSTDEVKKSSKAKIIDQTSSRESKSAAKIKKKSKTSQLPEELIDMEKTLDIDIHDDDNDEEFKQQDLIKEAFAGDNVVSEFKKEKRKIIKEEDDQEEDLTLPGWGDWAGGSKKSKKRKIIRTINGVAQKDKRKDKNLKNVIINERVNKKNLKYQSSEVPYGFESKEQYERSLRMPVGQEWTSRETHQKLTMPRIITKQGTVIDPLKAPFK